MAALPPAGSLEERLKALAPGGRWQEAFCSREGPKGSPTLLLVSPSAIGAVGLIKMLPTFNKVGGCLLCGVPLAKGGGGTQARQGQPLDVHASASWARVLCRLYWTGAFARALCAAEAQALPPPGPLFPLQACRVGKLFAKHFKVEEQEAVLRSQVGRAEGRPRPEGQSMTRRGLAAAPGACASLGAAIEVAG